MVTRLGAGFGQVPALVIDHLKILSPGKRPVIADEGFEGLEMLPLPLCLVQLPVPDKGVFAESTVLVALHKFCEGPATGVVAGLSICIVTCDELEQVPLVIVHSNTWSPSVKLVTAEAG
jgi:hypothetical protein